VDFWVDDVDAVVERAFHRGGSVVMPPVDCPVGTTAFLADPQGAAFSVSKAGRTASPAQFVTKAGVDSIGLEGFACRIRSPTWLA
jgi:hypothetical protein